MSAVPNWAVGGIGGQPMRPGAVATREASDRFASLTESIAAAYEPTTTQLQKLDQAYKATGDYLSTCQEFDGLLTSVHAHGSRQLGTIVRPMDAKRDGFDIDLVARLARDAARRYQGPEGPRHLLDHMFQAMSRYAQRHDLAIKRWERCITLTYADGMCADFAPVIDDPSLVVKYGELHGRIPDRELQRYLPTNPKGYCLAFDEVAKIQPRFRIVKALEEYAQKRADVESLPEATEVLARLLSRYVQLGKVHRNIMFGAIPDGKKFAPTSVFLTALFSEAYALEARMPHEGPLDLFMDMMRRVPHLFQRQRLQDGAERWTLPNPCAINDNLAESMNTPERQAGFSQWYDRLVRDLDELVSVASSGGLDPIVKVVERSFGTRASQSVLQRGAEQREKYRTLKQAGFVAAGSMPAVANARSHTYFGGSTN